MYQGAVSLTTAQLEGKLGGFSGAKKATREFFTELADLILKLSSEEEFVTIDGKKVAPNSYQAFALVQGASQRIQNASNSIIKRLEDIIAIEKRMQTIMGA